ncbi:heme-binding protein 2-like [Pecten maximus]|uniref:heme-binding protein 2-like n=1 Tax=Pecten maximus TaxID=6579 RepID=UPI00145867AC|nr:heme-binding protein 2-like [Pecten maximus]
MYISVSLEFIYRMLLQLHGMAALCLSFTILLGVLTLAEANTIPAGTCMYKGNKCPVYNVISNHEGYELRYYEQSSWVATSENVREYTGNVSRQLYFRLRDYIQGNNVNNEVLNMTVPVLTERGNPNVNGLTTYTKYFFLTDPNAPEPRAENVFRYNRPAFGAYVRRYGGRPNYQEKEAQLEKLKQSLQDTSLYNLDKAYFAGYNPPWDNIGRRNEVWVEAIMTNV